MRSKIFLGLIILLAALLRLYHLASDPPSLYWDEASLGYNAYAISQTLRDEHGEFLPIARFIAFGDYKAPGYIYAAAASVKLLDLSEFSIRLPSALAGILLVLVTFLLTQELLRLHPNYKLLTSNYQLPLLAAFFVAVSPWSLQFSRGAFEANLATIFGTLGIYFFLRSIRLRSSLTFIASALSFALSLYTFNSHRIFVPLEIVILGLIFIRELWSLKKQFLLFALILLILLLPLIPHLLSREGRLRFYEVTWLNDTAPIELSNERIAADGGVWWAKIVHNRRVDFSLQFLKHYTDHFRADFLFFSGDVNPRLSSQTTGEMYWLDLPLLLAGIFFLIRHRSKTSAIIFAWILLAPIPAATARETPHALRILQILPAPQILAALGASYLLFYLEKHLERVKTAVLWVLFILTYSFLIAAYLHDYYLHYPKVYASSWQYGYKQAVEYVTQNQGKYDHISVTENYGRPYIYFLFFQKYDPRQYWASRKVDRDWYGFWYVHGFDKYVFGQESSFGKWLYVHDAKPFPSDQKLLRVITDPAGQTVFQITEKK